MKKKILLSSILTIIICLCLIAGSTFALFTSTATISVSVTAANVDVTANIADGSLKTWSLGQTRLQAQNGPFVNGGSASISTDKQSLVINKMTPGDVVEFTINMQDSSDIDVKYKIGATASAVAGKTDLSDALAIKAEWKTSDGQITLGTYNLTKTNKSFTSGWISSLEKTLDNTIIVITVEFPNGAADHDNQFKGAETSIAFTIEAVQHNGLDSNGNYIEG